MIITSNSNLDKINEEFNYFHDGFFKKIQLLSGGQFNTNLPWEKKKQYSNNEEVLKNTFLHSFEKKGIIISIRHYNYNWPNQPYNREILIIAPKTLFIADNIGKVIGVDIFDLSFTFKSLDKITCTLTYHDQMYQEQNMGNGITMDLFSAKKIKIKEKKA